MEKQAAVGWGESVVERLAADLRAEFPDMRGLSISNIWRMRQMFQTLNTPDFLAQFVRESGGIAGSEVILAQAVRELASAIPWGHHVEILNKLTEPAPRLYYLKATAKFG